MRALRYLTVLALALVLAVNVQAAEKGKKKKGKGIKGVVTKVDKDSITVKVGKRGDAAEKTFKLTGTTTVEKVSGKKPDRKVTPATLSDVAVGARVAIKADGDTATSIKLREGKAKKNK
jgi:hypothetical protein